MGIVSRTLQRAGFDFTRLYDREGRVDEYRFRPKRERAGQTDLTIVSTIIEQVPIRFAIQVRDDMIQRHHFKGEFYEIEELHAIKRHFRGGTFVDVGANVGNHVIYAALFLRAEKIIAFEPGSVAATMLRCNVALNRLDNVEVFELGLSDRAGTATFCDVSPKNLGSARLKTDKPGNIKIVAGDDVIDRADFIKIDTEGLELNVLAGLRKTIEAQRPGLFVEVEDRNKAEFMHVLESMNYEVVETISRYDGLANYIAESR